MNNSIAILSWIIYGIGRIHFNTFKAAAPREAAISQTLDGVGNGDRGKTAATTEAGISQTRDGVGNGDGGQTAASKEAGISQTRDGVGNGDGGQTAASIKAVTSQTCDGICDTFKRHSFGNHYIACVFIFIRVIIVPLIGDSSRFIRFVQIVEDTVYLCVVRPRRKDST